MRFRNQVTHLFWFSLGGNVMDQTGGDGLFNGRIEVIAISCGQKFPEFWNAGREDCLCFEQDHPTLPLWEETVSRNRKPRKRTDFYEEDRPPHDLWLLSCYWCAWYRLIMRIYSLSLFAATMFRTSIRDGKNFYCQWPRSRRMVFWNVCTNWGYVSLINFKPYWNCTTWKFIRRYRWPIIRGWKNGEKEKRSETPTTKLRRQARENGNRSNDQEPNGIKWRWRRKRYLLPMERKRAVFEGWPVKFPTREPSSWKTYTKSRSTLWTTIFKTWGWSVSRKRNARGRRQSGKFNRPSCKILLERYLHHIAWWILASSRMSVLSVLSLEEFGCRYQWTSGQKPHLIKKGKKIHCDTSSHVPCVAPGWSTSSSASSSSSSPTSSSQETVTDTEVPATSRSEKASEDSSARGNSWHESTENENPNENDDEEFTEWWVARCAGLATGVQAWIGWWKWSRTSTCFQFFSWITVGAKVVPSKHNIFTHFPKEWNCDICLRTKIRRASWRRRTGTVVPRAEKLVI